MLVIGSIASDFGTAVGVVAGLIAVGGFLGHARPVLRGASQRRIQRATITRGLAGVGAGSLVVVLSAILGIIER